MTAGEGGSPSGGFSFPVWRSGDRLRSCQNPTRYARFRGPPEALSYKSRTAPFVQEAVFANKTDNYLIWLAPFTRVGSQVQSLSRPPSVPLHKRELMDGPAANAHIMPRTGIQSLRNQNALHR